MLFPDMSRPADLALHPGFGLQGLTRTGSSPFVLFLGLGFPYHPVKTKKGTLFVPRLLPV